MYVDVDDVMHSVGVKCHTITGWITSQRERESMKGGRELLPVCHVLEVVCVLKLQCMNSCNVNVCSVLFNCQNVNH